MIFPERIQKESCVKDSWQGGRYRKGRAQFGSESVSSLTDYQLQAIQALRSASESPPGPHLVVSYKLLLLVVHDSSLLLRSCNDALKGIGNLLLADLLQAATSGQNGSLVHQVLKVGTCGVRVGKTYYLVKIQQQRILQSGNENQFQLHLKSCRPNEEVAAFNASSRKADLIIIHSCKEQRNQVCIG